MWTSLHDELLLFYGVDAVVEIVVVVVAATAAAKIDLASFECCVCV